MTTGPHEPVPGGRYHEQPGRLASRTKTEPAVAPPSPPATLADVLKQLGALQQAVSGLGIALADSEVSLPQPEGATAAPAPKAAAPKNRDPGSDPALTRAERRRLRIFGAGIGVLLPLVATLATALGVAWSYIEGYGDDRAARALEIEESQSARVRLEAHDKQLGTLAAEQSTLVLTVAAVQSELVALRRYRDLHRLEAAYLGEVNAALAHRKKPPAKPAALVAAEAALGIQTTIPPPP